MNHNSFFLFYLPYQIPQKQIQLIQLMSKVRADQFPGYQTAGLKKDTFGVSAQMCLQPAERDIGTPEHVKKYRKSFKQQHGVTITHYGLVNDPLPPQHHTYGVITQKSEGANNIMKAGQKGRIGGYVNQIKEGKYESLKREPLARTINRNYNFPEPTKNDEFKFGLPTEDNKWGAKQTIYSAENMPQTEQVRQMYLKSHKDYDPGEQKQRPYNWPVDPADFRFGKVEKNPVHNQMVQIMRPEAKDQSMPKTVFVKSNLQDYFDKKDDKLGKGMNLGQKQFGSDRVFGVRVEANEWDAGKCLKGEANEYEVRPDDNLGKTNKYGFRNITKEGDEGRVFGVSTIRYDIPRPAQQSVADPINYADETTAVELLFPKQFSGFGVNEEDFAVVRPKAQIRQIFENIGFQFRGNIFDVCFERAKAIQGTILEKVSCNSFRQSILELKGR